MSSADFRHLNAVNGPFFNRKDVVKLPVHVERDEPGA